MMTTKDIPDWTELEHKASMTGILTPIEKFLLKFEPAGQKEAEEFREGIVNIVNYFESPLRPAMEWFAKEMEAKLKANDHKGGWKKCDLQYLSMRLTQERKELYGALKNRSGSFFGDTHHDKEIIGECADIANFAMMIADKFGKDFGK